MLYKLLFVKCIKMRGKCFWYHRIYYLCLNFRSIYKFESLICALICCLTLELQWLVLFQTNDLSWSWIACTDFSQHFIMFFKLLHLFFSKTLLVIWFTFKWKRIKWILWMFLMENIFITISPIWECILIWWLCQYWLAIIVVFSYFLFLRLNLKEFKSIFCSCFHVHFMRVYYLCFFF